jgi:hypothetical protein
MSSTQGLGPIDVISYEPGVCNIGPEEVARRRRAGHVGLIASVGLFLLLLAVAAPHWARLGLVLTVAASASGYLQAWLHFCAGFGSSGVYNFGPLGTVQQVADPGARSRDRHRSLEIGLASLVIGLVVGLGAVLLPVR